VFDEPLVAPLVLNRRVGVMEWSGGEMESRSGVERWSRREEVESRREGVGVEE